MTREEAILILQMWWNWHNGKLPVYPVPTEKFNEALGMAITALKEETICPILSDDEVKQPCIKSPCGFESPHGEWIDEGVMADGHSQHAFRCSKCGNHISRIPSNMPNFCENCGAELETVGYWFPDWSESYGKDGFRCSMCYRWTSEKEEKCHHCGARMKEGET